MLESFIISIVANLATAAGTKVVSLLIDNSTYRKIENAYSVALKSWSKNNDIAEREGVWTKKRLGELVLLMANPSNETEVSKGTLELLVLFKTELQKDTATWHYLQGEFYNNLMKSLLSIEKLVTILHQEIEQNKINPIELKNRLIDQTSFQVKKNINSGKYIPDVFMEVNELKDHVRFFSDPYLFYERTYNKIKRFNFDYLIKKQIEGKQNVFHFDVSNYKVETTADFHSFYETNINLLSYVNDKYEELYHGGNRSYIFSGKIRDKKDDLNFIDKRICILTADAGQGKTNFICDLSSNVLIKRGIPCIYLNGYEIDASTIEDTFAHAIYPAHRYSFIDILNGIEGYCDNFKKPFIIIIDGLNENNNSKLFCHNLNMLVNELLKYKFVKIILTCRTEYYKEQFFTLGQLHKNDTKIIKHIHSDLNDSQKERLVDNYLRFFKINVSISDDIRDELTENILLLRIFSEAYKGKTLPYVSDLRKDDLFQMYYKKMCDNISDKLSTNGYMSLTALTLNKFILQIVSSMIERHSFSNVPIQDILSNVDQAQVDLYSRFLDENILLRKDLVVSTGIFGSEEVINFTYDEFRDFLIASYLINKTYPSSEEHFMSFVTTYTKKGQQLAEGLRSFLFLMSKKNSDKTICQNLKTFDWYEIVFLKHIWEIDDAYIDDTDIALLAKLLPIHNRQIIPRLIFKNRWNTKHYRKINVNILFEFLESLSDPNLRDKLYLIFIPDSNNYYSREANDFDHLLNIHEELLSTPNFFKNDEAHNVFKFFLYLTPFSNRAINIYMSYLKKYGTKKQALEVVVKCTSNILKRTINYILKEQ